MDATPISDKEIRWIGSSFDDLCAFPFEPKKKAGFQLRKVQAGIDPDDWKPFGDVGAGVREIRIKDAQGIYRVMYVAKFEEAVMTKRLHKPVTAAFYMPERKPNEH